MTKQKLPSQKFKTIIRTVKIFLGIVFFLALTFTGFNLLAKSIYDRKDCKRFNIDNIELRTHTDIPAVLKSECNCNGNIKVSKFVIDSSRVNISDYTVNNNFEKSGDLFIKKGERNDTKWNASLNPHTNELLITIEYK
ncbi:hypothetical protein [Maribellus maritimus]|uniref:hypothetical protein n=1 Tax=Maribellus maritimus TaxID=2870838 RepID=UPI001EEAEA64|nr:hypothetical protein [Maribellus maritimus]MCG6189093.1 hypothetical protein [Maribellus maritimus]